VRHAPRRVARLTCAASARRQPQQARQRPEARRPGCDDGAACAKQRVRRRSPARRTQTAAHVLCGKRSCVAVVHHHTLSLAEGATPPAGVHACPRPRARAPPSPRPSALTSSLHRRARGAARRWCSARSWPAVDHESARSAPRLRLPPLAAGPALRARLAAAQPRCCALWVELSQAGSPWPPSPQRCRAPQPRRKPPSPASPSSPASASRRTTPPVRAPETADCAWAMDQAAPHTQTHSADAAAAWQTPDANGFFCSYVGLGSPIHVCVPAAHRPRPAPPRRSDAAACQLRGGADVSAGKPGRRLQHLSV
jgi:hypothetical protein